MHYDEVLCGADVGELRASRDGEALSVFGAGGIALPAAHGRQDHRLVDEVGTFGTRAGGYNCAGAVGEHGRIKIDGRVEVLADEEVAVVQSHGGQADEELIGTGSWFGDFFDLETGGHMVSWCLLWEKGPEGKSTGSRHGRVCRLFS